MEYLHTMVRVGNLDQRWIFTATSWSGRSAPGGAAEHKYTLVFLAAPGDVERARESRAPLV